MLAGYRLIQFIPNQQFPAPVTVGVVAWTNEETRLRFIGLDVIAGRVDVEVFRRAFGLPVTVEPTVLEWVRWFQDLISSRGRFVENAASALDRLESRSFPFIADQEGEADIGPKELDAFADDVFQRAVLAVPNIRWAYLETEAFKCLVGAGISSADANLTDDAEIVLPKTSAGPGLLSFSWFLDQGRRRAGFRVIDFEAEETYVGQQVANVLTTCEVARSREFLRRDQCFVLHGHGLEDYPNYAELFGDIATLIDLTDCNAADKLRTALSNT